MLGSLVICPLWLEELSAPTPTLPNKPKFIASFVRELPKAVGSVEKDSWLEVYEVLGTPLLF